MTSIKDLCDNGLAATYNGHYKTFTDLYEMLCHETYRLAGTSKSVLRFTKNGPAKNSQLSPIDFKKMKLKAEIDHVLDLLSENIADTLKLK